MIGKIFTKKEDVTKKKENIYLIYYFPPLIRYIPLTDKRLLNILLPYVYDYIVDGKEIKGILIFYGLPIHKKELFEFLNTKNPEKLYEYKVINFYTNLENLPAFQVRMVFNKLTNPNGMDVETLEFNYNGKRYLVPDIEINYYPLVYRAYTIYELLKEKETVLLKTTQRITSWKEAFAYAFSETSKTILTFASRYPLQFILLLVTVVVLIMMFIVMNQAISMLGKIGVDTNVLLNLTNITTVTP